MVQLSYRVTMAVLKELFTASLTVSAPRSITLYFNIPKHPLVSAPIPASSDPLDCQTIGKSRTELYIEFNCRLFAVMSAQGRVVISSLNGMIIASKTHFIK